MGVFSAHVPHALVAKAVELSAKSVQGRWKFTQVKKKKKTLSKWFGGQNGEQSVATMHI